MNTTLLIVLPVIGLVMMIIIFVSVLLARKWIIHKKKIDLIHKLKKQEIKSWIVKINSEINRIEKIHSQNQTPKIRNLFLLLDNLQDMIRKKINETVSAIYDLEEFADEIKWNKFSLKYQEIEQDIITIKKNRQRFHEESSQIVQQENFLRSEAINYSSHFWKIMEVYKENRFLLKDLAPRIDHFKKILENDYHAFNQSLEKGDAKKGNEILSTYSKNIKDLAEVVSKAPSFYSYIYILIPEEIKVLKNKLVKYSKEYKVSLDFLKIQDSISKIVPLYKELKVKYLQCSFKGLDESIIKIMKDIRNLSYMIEQEISNRQLLIQIFPNLVQELNLLNNFQSDIKARIKQLIGRGVILDSELTNKEGSAHVLFEQIKNEVMILGTEIQDSSATSSRKIDRVTDLLKKVDNLITIMNFISVRVGELDSKTNVYKLKFKKGISIFNDLIAKYKKMNLRIPPNDIKNQNLIFEQISKISTQISRGEITNLLAEEIDDLIEEIIIFVSAIGSKIEVATMVNNLFKELSLKRGINPVLNNQLSLVEQDYIGGNYKYALNAIVRFMEEEKNV